MHDWQTWVVPSLVLIFLAIPPVLRAAGRRMAQAEQRVALIEAENIRHRADLASHGTRIELLDNRLDSQISTLSRVEGKLDALLEAFRNLIHMNQSPRV